MVNVVKRRVQHSWHTFLAVLDSELVSMYQDLFYIFLMFGGAYNLFIADTQTPPTEGAIEGKYYVMWLTFLLIFPPMCMLGKRLKGSAAYSGLLMQFFGDVGVFAAVAIFTASDFVTTYWGVDGNFTIFNTAPTALAISMLVMRDVRRLLKVEKAVRS